MAKKITPLLVEKYDISHKIFSELANLESRHILFAIIKKPKRAQDISKETKIPLSSVYNRISSLKECSLMYEKSDFADNGHVVTLYQSLIKDAEINVAKLEPTIALTKNQSVKK
ncbi:hypothetical protein [Nitrosopumilus maritimus]|uniref:Transcriptional regulator n=1 Tax=Nitrosopumilus maritimus (strain SCM1) TaxID=436308 RepID=A9A2L9_NITMS|nr:hypothetical protein [Nitrosopumilus maritimus]ABX13258.1 hypothetical protein Nmar_1362 [Nitrosopumilus maritimus SCM1]